MPDIHLPSAQSELRDDFALGIVVGKCSSWGEYLNLNKEKLEELWRKAYEVADCGMQVRLEA